jgi:hypothetical protein
MCGSVEITLRNKTNKGTPMKIYKTVAIRNGSMTYDTGVMTSRDKSR